MDKEQSVKSKDMETCPAEKKRLVFATNNKHKLQEAREILGDKFEIVSLADIDCHDDIPETAETLEGNALIKANWVKEKYGFECFADDTGLMVDALDGAPGVYSARYAGEHCSFADNVNKMLREMKGKENRKAHFATVIALLMGGKTQLFEGRVDGTIATEPHGDGGFGYDPIFIAEETGRSFAEMTPDEKNAISHRGRALRKMAAALLLSPAIFSTVMMAETVTLTPGLLPSKVKSWAQSAPIGLQLAGEATALDLVSLKDLPAGVETLDMSGLEIKGITLQTSNYLGQTEFADGEIPPYSLFCTGVKTITLPACVSKIGEAAFAESAITAIELPAGVTEIGARAFYKCVSLETANLSKTSVTRIPEECFYGCTSLRSSSFPLTVTKVDKRSFMKSGVSIVELPNASAIGEYAFAGMPNLQEVTISSTATIDEGAFYGDGSLGLLSTSGSNSAALAIANSGLQSLTGSVSGEIVDEGAYANIKADTIVIHPSVKEIKSHAFHNANNLKTVDVSELGSTIPAIAGDAFSGVDVSKVRLAVADSNASAWKAAPVWNEFMIGNDATTVPTLEAEKITVTLNGGMIEVSASSPIEELGIWTVSGMTLLKTAPGEMSYTAGPFEGKDFIVRVKTAATSKIVKLQN